MKKIIPIFYGKVEKGRLKHSDPARLSMYLIYLESKEVEIIIKEKKQKRTLNQNSYYWGVVLKVLSEHLGYWDFEMHDIMKQMFLKFVDKKGYERTQSTTKMNTKEMTDYIENIRMWAASEFQVNIPDADANIEWGAEEE